jgi:hypothetical protein
MALCTVPDGESPSIEIAGDTDAEYILAFDPSWSQTESSDDFAIQILKLNEEQQRATLVHSYALAGTSLKCHIRYLLYCLENFNVIAICGDYNGGVQFLQACNESEIFKKKEIKLKQIEVAFDKPEEYEDNLRLFKQQYNKEDNKHVILRKPTSNWIRQANELLQANFDHRRIMFASQAIDDQYTAQKNKNIPIEEIRFLRPSETEKQSSGAKQIDFIEHQADMMNMTKNECALIQITTTAQGTQTFDLPSNLRRQTGADKARKDSYSALILANWMTKIYFDSKKQPKSDIIETFEPMFVN